MFDVRTRPHTAGHPKVLASSIPGRTAAWSPPNTTCRRVSGMLVLYGLYLIIPQFR